MDRPIRIQGGIRDLYGNQAAVSPRHRKMFTLMKLSFHPPRTWWLLGPWFLLTLAFPMNFLPAADRNLATDEPRTPKGKPTAAADYVPTAQPSDGQHLALTLHKLQHGIQPPRPFVIWALGSSYCNMLGNGEAWKTEIPKRFPQAPPIEYRKMVGNSCPATQVLPGA